MGKIFAGLDDRLRQFIVAQPVFFVATAPGCTGQPDAGHVNVSPKGYRDTFAVLGPTTVAYLDLTGSGAETIAHLRQNGRITIMFCSFTETPKILRLYGSGRVVLPGDPDWAQLASHFPATQRDAAGTNGHSPAGPAANGHADAGTGANGHADAGTGANGHADAGAGAEGHADAGAGAGADGHSPAGAEADGFSDPEAGTVGQRAIIVAELDRIADSCGYAVPVMELREERDLLTRWSERKTPPQLAAYRAEKNELSIDGLPALG